MNSRDQIQLSWFYGYIGCMPITPHLPISTASWLEGPTTAELLSCHFSRLLLALRKDLDSANDHYTLCLYWVGAQSSLYFRREYTIIFCKSILFIHLFTCCLQTYEYHYKMNHVTVLCFKTLFPKEADGRDWQQLLKTFVSLCMYSKEWGLPKTQNRKGKTFPYYKVIMANFIKYHLFSFLVKQKTGEERKIIMKELHMLLEALAICQYKCFPIRRSRVLYLLQCIRSYFIKIQDPPPCLGVKHRNTQKYIAGIMGLGLVSFCRWNQLTSTCFAHVCHRLRVLHLQPMEKSSKPLSKLPHMNLAL